MNEDLVPFFEYYASSAGLLSSAVDKNIWFTALENRMRAKGVTSVDQYIKLFESQSREKQNFLEEVVVPETWFFREQHSFDFLKKWVKNQPKNERWRILSVPCSTGEEPYSIAIKLFEVGVSEEQFIIDAVDISEIALAKAVQATYFKNSFRTASQKHLEIYFSKKESGYQLIDLVRRCVRFGYGNLTDPNFVQFYKPYDLIFCRNIFIYLNDQGLEQSWKNIKTLLKPNGTLIVTPAEMQTAISNGFHPLLPLESCAFVKEKISVQSNEKVVVKDDDAHLLKSARQHANEGEFEQASRLCLRELQDSPSSYESCYLLGVIAHAQGEIDEARKYFEMTLKICPEHEEALVYRKLLSHEVADE